MDIQEGPLPVQPPSKPNQTEQFVILRNPRELICLNTVLTVEFKPGRSSLLLVMYTSMEVRLGLNWGGRGARGKERS